MTDTGNGLSTSDESETELMEEGLDELDGRDGDPLGEPGGAADEPKRSD